MYFESHNIAASLSMVNSLRALGTALRSARPMVCNSPTGKNSDTFISRLDEKYTPYPHTHHIGETLIQYSKKLVKGVTIIEDELR